MTYEKGNWNLLSTGNQQSPKINRIQSECRYTAEGLPTSDLLTIHQAPSEAPPSPSEGGESSSSFI